MSDIREALEQAIGSGESDDENVEEVETTMSAEDNTGTELDDNTENVETPEPTETVEASDQQTEGKESDTTTVSAEKPPVGWSPSNREHWAGLPDALKQQISKREREVNDVLQKSSVARKASEAISGITNKYQNVMQSEGINDPMQAINGLFETASVLVSGNPQVKAQRIANLIQHYGVDIGSLDDILSGSPQVQGQAEQNDPMMQALDKRLAPMQQMFDSMQNQQQQFQQNQQQRVNDEVSNFEKTAEFIGDVRNDMADLMDMAAKRGQGMTIQQAYDKAVLLNPEIAGVLAQRKQQEDLGVKRGAASSLNGRLGGGGGNSTADYDLRQTLEGAWAGEYD